MSFKYYDVSLGTKRYKRRFIWWLWAYLAGLASGLVLVAAIYS
jgi:hypothetical protein